MKIYTMDASFLKLSDHYYKYVEFDLPIYAVLDDMAKSMDARGKTYVMLPRINQRPIRIYTFILKSIKLVCIMRSIMYIWGQQTKKTYKSRSGKSKLKLFQNFI